LQKRNELHERDVYIYIYIEEKKKETRNWPKAALSVRIHPSKRQTIHEMVANCMAPYQSGSVLPANNMIQGQGARAQLLLRAYDNQNINIFSPESILLICLCTLQI
jgi:hypothetical protein